MAVDRSRLFAELDAAVAGLGYNPDAQPLAAHEFTTAMYAGPNASRGQLAQAATRLRRLLKAGVLKRERRKVPGSRQPQWVYWKVKK